MAAAAENICGQLNAKIAAETKTSKSIKALPEALRRRVRLEQSVLSELAKLRPRAAIARAWVQILAHRRTLANNLVKFGEKYSRGESLSAVYASTATVERELLAVGQRAGFEQCARVG